MTGLRALRPLIRGRTEVALAVGAMALATTAAPRIERELPGEAAVFELQYVSLPEFSPPPPGRTVVYDLLRPYLHADRLRWSSGAMHGRPADWATHLTNEPLREVVPLASAVSFDGIYVDRFGYSDDATADAVEQELM